MIQEHTIQPVLSPQSNDDEPTEPRIPAQQSQTGPRERVLQVRHNATFTVSMDEQGIVRLLVPGQDALVLKPEEAFDLLDFLFEYRNLLAARSAEIAEQQGETQKECK
jgi:hypothetical protein